MPIKNVRCRARSTFRYVIVHTGSKIVCLANIGLKIAANAFQIIYNKFTVAIDMAFNSPVVIVGGFERRALLYIQFAGVTI